MSTQRWNSRKLTAAPDNITDIKNTIANKLQESKLISEMEILELDAIKSKFISILNEKTTRVAPKTKRKYLQDVEKISNKSRMQYFLINFQLKADGLGIN